MVRTLVLVLLLGYAAQAAAQPVGFELVGEVAQGQKPTLKVTAAQAVRDLRVELTRGDGRQFTMQRAALAKGQSVSFAIGDGAAGLARYRGSISAKTAAGEPWSDALEFETLVRAPIKVSYDLAHLDLAKRVLEFKLSRPAGSAELVVIGEDGRELGTGSATYRSEPADTWLPIHWTQPPETRDVRVMMLKLRAVAADGLVANVELIPWSVTIDHEDVNFSLDSAVIEPSEQAKLDASLAQITLHQRRIEKFMKLRLYVAGHTDTVGPNAKNRTLSLARARAIAGYFRKKGLALPIAVAGYGEEVLKAKTADNIDERINRRADYVLGPANAQPPFGGPYAVVQAAWQSVP